MIRSVQPLRRGLDDQTIVVRFPAAARDLRLLRTIKTGSGIQPASYSMRSAVSFPGVKAAGA